MKSGIRLLSNSEESSTSEDVTRFSLRNKSVPLSSRSRHEAHNVFTTINIMKMQTCLFASLFLGHAIVSFQAYEGIRSSYSKVRRTKRALPDGEMQNSEGLRSKHVLRRTSYADIMNHIWYAAVSGNSDSTSSIHQKCKLEDGTVVVVGEDQYYYYDTSKSTKGSMSSKGSKGSKSCRSGKGKGENSRCSPTVAPTSVPTRTIPTLAPNSTHRPTSTPTLLPTISPTDCSGKSKESCKKSKKMMSSKSHKSKLSKRSKMSMSMSTKSMKGKYADADVPYCSDLTMAPTSSSNINTPAPTKVQGLDTLAPTVSPTSTDDFDRCNDIRNGTGNFTGEPSQTMKLYVAVESQNELDDDFAEKLNAAMRTLLALSTGCQKANFTTRSGRRVLQQNPDAVELVGFTLLDLQGGTCEAVFDITISSEICTAFESLVRAFGGSLDNVAQACQEYGPQIAAALEVDRIQCVVDMFPFEVFVPTLAPTLSPTESPTFPPTNALTPFPTDNEITPRDTESLETGGWIAIAAGALILFSLCLCYICSRRNRETKERDAAVAYTKTFDDDSSHGSPEVPSNTKDSVAAGTTSTSRTAVFVNPEYSPENENRDTDIAPTDEEEEYPIEGKEAPTGLHFEAVEQPSSDSPAEDMMLHEKGQVCSSPTCRLCEDRRQQEVAKPPSQPKWSTTDGYSPRDYVQDDTVEL